MSIPTTRCVRTSRAGIEVPLPADDVAEGQARRSACARDVVALRLILPGSYEQTSQAPGRELDRAR